MVCCGQWIVCIELARPWEENLGRNHDLKKGWCNQLAIDLREGKHLGGIRWKLAPLCVDNRMQGHGM